VTKIIKIPILLLGMAVVAILAFVLGESSSSGELASGLFSNGRKSDTSTMQPESHNITVNERQRALEDRMARLQAQMATISASATTANPHGENDEANDESAGDPMQVDPNLRRMELLNVIDQNTVKFENQGYDTQWSEKATSNLRAMLSGVIAKLGAQLQDVECKTTDCMATVEFESFETVRDGADFIAMHRYPVNCSLRLSTPEPENANEPYRMKMFFQNCTRDEENM
jgi:hypothetical protein